MKSLSAPVVAAALLVAGVNAQFQINTPTPPTQCVPSQFTWTGGTAPFFLAIVPGGVPGATALQQYPNLSSSPFTWSTNISAGTTLGLTLTDHDGAVAQSAPFTVASGPDSSCLTGAAASSGSTGAATSAAATSGSAAATSAAASGTTSKAASSGTGAGSATASTSKSTSTSASSSSSGALSNIASAGLVGAVGVLAAALLA